jgi:hypothetical protein
MNPPRDQSTEALESALRAAHENERRWMEVCPEFSSDSEQMAQWTSTAKLRRLEVERIESLLANGTKHSGFPRPVGNEAVEAKDRLGETWRVSSSNSVPFCGSGLLGAHLLP